MATPITNENIDQFAITPANINDMAEVIASLNEYDFIYIVTYKAGAYSLSRIELNVFKTAVGAGLSADDIVNNLTSTATNKALSAAQGKVLKELIDGRMFSSEIYTALKNNIDALWGKLNELIGDLASLAFSGTKTNQLTPNDKTAWPSQQGGGETPSSSPILTYPANNSTVNVGTNTGNGITKSITIQGSNLTQALSVSVSGAGFSVSPTPISAANANNGTTITVTYNGTDTNANGTLTISSSEVSATVNLTASYQQQGGGDEPTPSEITFSKPSFKLNSIISASSSNGNIVTETRNGHVCCTEFVELTGEWDRVEINYNFSNQSIGEAIYCKVVCRYKNLDTGTTGYTSAGPNSLVTTTNNNYDKDTSNLGIISVKRLWENERLESGQAEGNYEVTGIAFSVRKVNDAPSEYSYAKIYADASDTNPQFIFDGSDSSTYDIEA